MFILSGEGHRWLDRGTWTTHKILGTHTTETEALANPILNDLTDEDTVILTDTDTGTVKNVNHTPDV